MLRHKVVYNQSFLKGSTGHKPALVVLGNAHQLARQQLQIFELCEELRVNLQRLPDSAERVGSLLKP